MTPDEILKGLYDETMVGNKPAVLELTQVGLDSGIAPETMLFEALIPSLEEVGARFERGDALLELSLGEVQAGELVVTVALAVVVLGLVRAQFLAEQAHQFAALRRRHQPPRLESLVCRLDLLARLRRRDLPQRRDPLARHRTVNVHVAARKRRLVGALQRMLRLSNSRACSGHQPLVTSP